jgi:hypothetical protein
VGENRFHIREGFLHMGTLSAATSRILNSKLERKIMSAATAAGLIQTGDQIGMSGFTGSGYPKGGAD